MTVDGIESEAFSVETGLKQGDSLSPSQFNLDLEKSVRALEDEDEARGINVDKYKIKVLSFADNLIALGYSYSHHVTAKSERVKRANTKKNENF